MSDIETTVKETVDTAVDNTEVETEAVSYEEALKRIIGAIDSPEELDNEIAALVVLVDESKKWDSATDYKTKYESLKDKYAKRFGEMIDNGDFSPSDVNKPPTSRKRVTIDDLDFNGMTE